MASSHDIDLHTGGQVVSHTMWPSLGHDLFWGFGIGFIVGLLVNFVYDMWKDHRRKKNRRPRIDLLGADATGVYVNGYIDASNYEQLGKMIKSCFSITKSPKRKNLKSPEDSSKEHHVDYVSDKTDQTMISEADSSS